MNRISTLGCIIFTTALFVASSLAQDPAIHPIARESVSTGGTEGNNNSGVPSTSFDGRFLVFFSEASNLMNGTATPFRQVYLRDRFLDTTSIVSLNNNGENGNGDSTWPHLSADGRFVAFESAATNLADGDNNGDRDIFVRDLQLGTVERVSVSTAGTEASGNSYNPFISFNGRYVVFHSEANNLVAGDQNHATDVFVRDRTAGTTVRASVSALGVGASLGGSNASISADGIIVVFESDSTNLVEGDTNGVRDIFIKNLSTGAVACVSQTSLGEIGNGPSSSARVTPDGRFISFTSEASNLDANDTGGHQDVFLLDLFSGKLERVNTGFAGDRPNASCYFPDLSAEGRYIAYSSQATNIVEHDDNGREDVFVYDRILQLNTRISLAPDGTQIDGFSNFPAVSGDGTFVAFMSDATNLMETQFAAKVHIYGFDFKIGAPPAPIPFKTMSIVPVRSRMTNSPKAHKDQFQWTGTIAMNQLSVDGVIAPGQEAIEIHFGDPTNPVMVNIPANDPNWKTNKKGIMQWKSPKGAEPNIQFRFDPSNSIITIRVTKFNFTEFPEGNVLTRIQIGNDMGLTNNAWLASKNGAALFLNNPE
ncbi:MAG: TolB family protein [Planctomycetota bacterium]